MTTFQKYVLPVRGQTAVRHAAAAAAAADGEEEEEEEIVSNDATAGGT